MAMGINDGHLFQARAYRDVFEEAGEDRLAAFERGGDDHAVRFDASEFARVQIGDDYDFAADEFFRFVGFCYAGDDGSRFWFADIDFQVEEFIGSLDRLGGFDQTYSEIDFREIVELDFGRRRVYRS